MDAENINSMWGIVGIIVCACGVYALYWLYKMKTTGEINATMLLGKDFLYKKCKNKEEYIRKASPALLGFGLIALIYGVLDVIHCYVYPMPIVDTVGMGIFFVVLVAFAVYTTKLKREYF